MDERLETVSEKIRMGIPVSMTEAIEAIDYQQKLKDDRASKKAKTLIGRFMRWIAGFKPTPTMLERTVAQRIVHRGSAAREKLDALLGDRKSPRLDVSDMGRPSLPEDV